MMMTKNPDLDLRAIKTRQQATWASGDFAIIGTTLQLAGKSLCEAADIRSGSRVLDVACGNGNASLAAARRFARVTGLDYVPALLAKAKRRAEAEALEIELVEGDAEAMPFEDGSFDAVLSTFGVMFAPDHAKAASELVRVSRPGGGKIGLACWTPEGVVGEMLRIVSKYLPPPAGLMPPPLWGKREHLVAILGDGIAKLETTKKDFMFRYESAQHFVDIFRDYYGPTHKAFGALDAQGQAGLAADLKSMLERNDRGGGRGLVVPAEYLEIVATRR